MSQCSNCVAVCCSGSESQGGLFWRAVRPQSSLSRNHYPLLIPLYSCRRSWQLSQLYLTLNDLLEKKEHASGAKDLQSAFSWSTSSIPWYFMQFAVWTRDCSHHMSHTTNAQRCKVHMYTHVNRLWMVTTCNDTTLSEYLDRGPWLTPQCVFSMVKVGGRYKSLSCARVSRQTVAGLSSKMWGQISRHEWCPSIPSKRRGPQIKKGKKNTPTNFVDGDLQ